VAFDLGDLVPLSFQIRDTTGALANATTVTLNITQPDSTISGPFTLTSATTGVYNYDYLPVQVGRHVARCVATGANASSFSDAFDVAPADMGAVISLADAKGHLNIQSTINDDELRLYLSAVTNLVEAQVGLVVPRTFTEVMGAFNSIVLNREPVISVTSMLTTAGVDLSGYFALNGEAGMLQLIPTTIGYPFAYRPYNFPGQPLDRLYYQGLLPFYQGQPITVTYQAGRQVVPAGWQLAARMILNELWASRRGAMAMPARGGDQEQPVVGTDYTLNDRVLELLATSGGSRAPRVA
jgi:hypothetical protein